MFSLFHIVVALIIVILLLKLLFKVAEWSIIMGLIAAILVGYFMLGI
jgi:hypothetical protein